MLDTGDSHGLLTLPFVAVAVIPAFNSAFSVPHFRPHPTQLQLSRKRTTRQNVKKHLPLPSAANGQAFETVPRPPVMRIIPARAGPRRVVFCGSHCRFSPAGRAPHDTLLPDYRPNSSCSACRVSCSSTPPLSPVRPIHGLRPLRPRRFSRTPFRAFLCFSWPSSDPPPTQQRRGPSATTNAKSHKNRSPAGPGRQPIPHCLTTDNTDITDKD